MFQMIVAWKYSEFLNRESRNMKVIETAWEDFRKKVMHPESPAIQVQEMRRAFYAGAAELLDSMLKLFSPDKEPTESDMLIMDGIKAELLQFSKDMLAGKV